MNLGGDYRMRKGVSVKKLLAASVLGAFLATPALAPSAEAADSVTAGRTIEAFIGTNLVDLQNYPAGQQVTINVIRNGLRVGTVTSNTDATGFMEINHVGGGQFGAGGDCFAPPATPDIKAGDVIQATVAGETVTDSATVRDVGVDYDSISVNTRTNRITVSGHARSRADAPIRPGRDFLELRLNKGNPNNNWEVGPGLDQDRPGRKDLRVDIGRNLNANDKFTRVLRVSHNDAVDWKRNPGEVTLEWSLPAADFPPAIFVADEGAGNLPGCPPLGEYAVKNSNPKAIGKAFVAGNAPLTVSGLSFDATNVRVIINDTSPLTAPLEATGTLSQPDGKQRWTASFTNAQAGRLKDGNLSVNAIYTVEGQNAAGAAITRNLRGENLRILKDTVAPARSPVASPKPGIYNRALRVSLSAPKSLEIHYTVNGARPTPASKVFNRPIRVTGTQTIKAIAVDKAGNRSPVGNYRYVIR